MNKIACLKVWFTATWSVNIDLQVSPLGSLFSNQILFNDMMLNWQFWSN